MTGSRDVEALYHDLYLFLGERSICQEFVQDIKKTIQAVVDRIPEDAKIGIRPGGIHTEKFLEQFDFSRKSVVGIFDQQKVRDELCGYPCYTLDELDGKECDYIIISSFYSRKEIKQELESSRYVLIELYDELEKHGISLADPYYFYRPDSTLTENYFYHIFLNAIACGEAQESLVNLMQAAVEQKDFVLLKTLYKTYGTEYSVLKEAWHKAERILSAMRRGLELRQQKDIFLFFIDCVPYSMLHFFPNLQKIAARGCLFQQAYAHTPYTNPTMRAIFRSILPIDNFEQTVEKIGNGNSELVKYLEESGYRIRITSHLSAFDEQLESRFYSKIAACNVKWWDGVIEILNTEEPCFYIFHFMAEPHPPYYSPMMEHVSQPYQFSPELEHQIHFAYAYMDECLAMYHELAGQKIQVFFSDHGFPGFIRSKGQGKNEVVYQPWDDHRLHAFCFAVGEDIPAMTVSKIFPYCNFSFLLKWLMDPTIFSFDDICSDELIFQDIDFYNEYAIRFNIHSGIAESCISYRGYLNDKYKYVINAVGKEFFYLRNKFGKETQIPLEDDELREELRKKCGTKFLDIYKIEKFQYTRQLYQCIQETYEKDK